MWLHFVCVSRPDPGDVVDNALRRCDIEESKCISFLHFNLRIIDYVNVKFFTDFTPVWYDLKQNYTI